MDHRIQELASMAMESLEARKLIALANRDTPAYNRALYDIGQLQAAIDNPGEDGQDRIARMALNWLVEAQSDAHATEDTKEHKTAV
jgi:hypothetical protein